MPLFVLFSLVAWIKNRKDTTNYFWQREKMEEAGFKQSWRDGMPILAVFIIAFCLLPVTSPDYSSRAFALMFFSLVGACLLIRRKAILQALDLGVPASHLKFRKGDYWGIAGVGIWLIFFLLLALHETVGS